MVQPNQQPENVARTNADNVREFDQKRTRVPPPRATREDYVNDEFDNQPPIVGRRSGLPMNNGKGGFPFIGVLVAVVIAVLISYAWLGMMNGGSYVKQDSDALNWQGFDARVDGRVDVKFGGLKDQVAQSQVQVAQLKNQVESAVANIPTSVNNAVNQALAERLSNYVQQSDLNDVVRSSMLSGYVLTTAFNTELAKYVLKTDTTTFALKSEIATLTAEINAMKVQIQALTTPTNPSSSGAIGITVKKMGDYLIASTNTTITGYFMVTLTNNTSSPITDIILQIDMQTAQVSTTPPSGVIGYALTGGGIGWIGFGSYNSAMFYNNTWGLNLTAKGSAGSSKTIQFTYTLTMSTGYTITPGSYYPYEIAIAVN